MSHTIEELQKQKEVTVDEIDDEVAGCLKRIRVLEQQKDDAWHEFEVSMFDRMYNMVSAVVEFHFPDIELKVDGENKVRKELSKMLKIKMGKKDLKWPKRT